MTLRTHFARLLAIQGLLLFAAPWASEAVPQVQIGLNFTGTTLHVNAEAAPPNADGAIGLNQYVELVNGRYAVYDKTSGAVLTSSLDKTFWQNSGISFSLPALQVSDPRVFFDPLSSRWFASGVDVNYSGFPENRFLLAVSKTSNPLDGWNGVAFDPDPSNSNFYDFARIGIDASGVYASVNLFNIGATTLTGQALVSIPKSDLLGLTPTVANRTTFIAPTINANTYGQTLQPVITLTSNTGGENVLGVGSVASPSIKVSTITNATVPAGAILSSAASVTVDPYTTPPSVRQPDGTATVSNMIDTRIAASVYQVGNIVYSVQITKVGLHSAIRWYRIDSATDTLLESDTISDPTADFSYASIAANADGVIVIGFNKSSSTEYLSSYAVAGQTVDGVTTFTDPILLQAGSANYHFAPVSGKSRWGDFSTTTVDPLDPTIFWTNQEIASATDVWSTQITELQIVPEPSTTGLLSFATISSAFFRLRRKSSASPLVG